MLVLVIEDDDQIRNNLVEILELEGYDTISESNGAEGIETAITRLPDIIFCDLMMPEVNGYKVLEALRNTHKMRETPFIFVTARTEREAIEKGMAMGATDFLLKPFTTTKILDVLQSFA